MTERPTLYDVLACNDALRDIRVLRHAVTLPEAHDIARAFMPRPEGTRPFMHYDARPLGARDASADIVLVRGAYQA